MSISIETERRARNHFTLHEEIGRAMTDYDFHKVIDLITQRDAAARMLLQAGWTVNAVSANAIGRTVEDFAALAAEGIYAAGFGMSHEDYKRFQRPVRDR